MGVGARPPLTAARVVAALTVWLVAVGCTRPPGEEAGVPGEELTFPARPSLRLVTDPVETLDPSIADTPAALLLVQQIFDGLVTYDPETMGVAPAAAQRWQVEDGGRRFVFHLRPDGRFHDGTPVRAVDFVFAWQRLADPLRAAPFAFLLESLVGYDRYQEGGGARALDGVRAVDPLTLEVRLTKVWPDFVSLLAHPALSPVPHASTELAFDERPIGNGPYRVAGDPAAGPEIRLERFDEYYGGAAAVERLEFVQIEEPAETWPEFLGGELDVAPVPPSLLVDAEGRYGAGGFVPLARLLYCGFNQHDPRFAHRELRHAVSLALDRQDIAARVYGGLAIPADGIVPPSIPGAGEDPCGPLCDRDVERARALVERVPRASRAFSLDYTASGVGDRLAHAIQAQLAEVGLTVRRRAHDEAAYQELIERDQEQLFCVVWSADYPRQQALLEPLFASASADNLAAVDIAALDRLLVRARSSRRPAERQELYRRAETQALEAMPLVPLVWFRSHLAAKPYVEGFTVSPLGTFDAAALSIAS